MKRILLNLSDEMYDSMKKLMRAREQRCVTSYIRGVIQGDISQYELDTGIELGKPSVPEDLEPVPFGVEPRPITTGGEFPPNMRPAQIKPSIVAVQKSWGCTRVKSSDS